MFGMHLEANSARFVFEKAAGQPEIRWDLNPCLAQSFYGQELGGNVETLALRGGQTCLPHLLNEWCGCNRSDDFCSNSHQPFSVQLVFRTIGLFYVGHVVFPYMTVGWLAAGLYDFSI